MTLRATLAPHHKLQSGHYRGSLSLQEMAETITIVFPRRKHLCLPAAFLCGKYSRLIESTKVNKRHLNQINLVSN